MTGANPVKWSEKVTLPQYLLSKYRLKKTMAETRDSSLRSE
jgi:hypothetical protein